MKSECVTLEDLQGAEWRLHMAMRANRRRIIAALGLGLSLQDYALLNATLVRAVRVATKLKIVDDATQRV